MSVRPLPEWVRRRGGSIDGVEVRSPAGGGRGLYASRDLRAGEQIIVLPRHALLTGDAARANPHVARVLREARAAGLFDTLGELAQSDDDAVAIVLLLLLEKAARLRRADAPAGDPARADSKWAAWIDSLPEAIWTPQTAPEHLVDAWLRKSPILPLVHGIRRELRVLYDEVVVPHAVRKFPDAYPEKYVTYDLFLWAHSVTETRGFDGSFRRADSPDDSSVASDDSHDSVPGTLLTPFADMANHSCHRAKVNAHVNPWFPPGEDRAGARGFQMVVKRDVPQDSEVFISYGDHHNSHLLMHYGFADPGRDNDRIRISLSEPGIDSTGFYTKQTLLLALACNGELGTEHELTVADPLPPMLVGSLRLLLMTPEEAQHVTYRTDFCEPLSRRNEAETLSHLEGILMHLKVEPPDVKAPKGDTGLAALGASCSLYMTNTATIINEALKRKHALEADLEAADEAAAN